MGTLFAQQPRNFYRVGEDDLSYAINSLKAVAKAQKLEFSTVLEVAKLLEKRRELNIACANHDALDEQLAGFGEILLQFLEELARDRD